MEGEKTVGLLRSSRSFLSSETPPIAPSPDRSLVDRAMLLKSASFRSTSSATGDVPHYALPTTNSFRLQAMNSFRNSSPLGRSSTPPHFNGSFRLQSSNSFRIDSPASRSNSPPNHRNVSPKNEAFQRTPTFDANLVVFEPAEPAAVRAHVDAQLAINSLILLGFDSDEYVKTYSGIAYDLIPLNRDTFDHSGGDKMLLIILHYLLCILDPEQFLMDIKSCWPYLDARERNCFKGAVNSSLKRLIDQHVIPADAYQPSYLNNHDRHATWRLLRELTDVCLDTMLPETVSVGSSLDQEQDKDVLLGNMEAQLEKVIKMMSDHQDVTDEYRTYLQELVDRVHAANRLLNKQTLDMDRNAVETSAANMRNKKKILGQKGMKIRLEKIDKINAQKDLLQSFMDSELLQNIEKFLEQDANEVQLSGKKSPAKRALRKAKTMSAEDFEQYKEQMRDCIGQLISALDSVCDLI